MVAKYDVECPVHATDLALRLSLPETAGEAIDRIVDVFRDQGNLEATAKELGVGTRTLQRWISRAPELARRINLARLERNPLR
jgi:ActR/RegA family two-component response regulator